MLEFDDYVRKVPKFKELNCLQEQVVGIGKCPFCRAKFESEYEDEGFFEEKGFCKYYHCPECGQAFLI